MAVVVVVVVVVVVLLLLLLLQLLLAGWLVGWLAGRKRHNQRHCLSKGRYPSHFYVLSHGDRSFEIKFATSPSDSIPTP